MSKPSTVFTDIGGPQSFITTLIPDACVGRRGVRTVREEEARCFARDTREHYISIHSARGDRMPLKRHA